MDNNTFINNSYMPLLNGDRNLHGTRYTLIGFMVLVAVIGIPGNLIVSAVLIKLQIKTTTDYLILTMSCIDLFSATINTTCYVIRFEPTIWNALASVNICRLHIFSIYMTSISTTLLLAATAFDRYRKTKSTSTVDTQSATIKARRVCFCIIISSFIYGIIYMFIKTLDLTSLNCVVMDGYQIAAVMFNSILGLVFIFMFLIVIACYVRISIFLRRHHQKLFEMKMKNTNAQLSNKIGSKKCRIQPLDIDNELPCTSKVNSTYSDFETQETVLQNKPPNSYIHSHMTTSKMHAGDMRSNGKIKGDLIVDESKECNLKETQRRESAKCTAVTEDTASCLKKEQPSHIARNIITTERDTQLKKINITTLTMFLITLMYVSTWCVNWSIQIIKVVRQMPSLDEDGLTKRLYMINCMTNPILYILMSSKFRQRAKEMFCKS